MYAYRFGNNGGGHWSIHWLLHGIFHRFVSKVLSLLGHRAKLSLSNDSTVHSFYQIEPLFIQMAIQIKRLRKLHSFGNPCNSKLNPDDIRRLDIDLGKTAFLKLALLYSTFHP